MKSHVKISILLLALVSIHFTSRAEIAPDSLFSDNAVLQRNQLVPVWGTATKGEKISVEFAGQKVSTLAMDGGWRVWLKPLKAGGPFTMTIIGSKDDSLALTNILVGDVWLASGQSNMQDPLGPTWWAQPIRNYEKEIAAASYPQIRQFKVPMVLSYHHVSDVEGNWTVCSPKTAGDFSAAGYFFARDLQKDVKVPIGILFSAWGGTVAEAWTSADFLKKMPAFTNALSAMQTVDEAQYPEVLAEWYCTNDIGSSAAPAWSDPSFDAQSWPKMKLPNYFQHAGLPNFNGIVWFRKEIYLPDSWTDKGAMLHLGQIDDQDTTWVNGVRVGGMFSFADFRNYAVPAPVFKPGRNVIAVRVLDTGGLGGIYGKPENMKLEVADDPQIAPVDLSGEWQYHATMALTNLPTVPVDPSSNPNVVTVLYRGMIEPLEPFSFKGVIWYQGESNDDTPKRAFQYRSLLPLMIRDWRNHWGIGDFPFLFVQIAPYRDMTPLIRESQLLTLEQVTNTAIVVLTDAGEADNIHPRNKQIVGARLALAARALAYGEHIEYSGPLYQSMNIEGSKAVLSFTHIGNGLMAKGGALKGFAIAGTDKEFVPAKAEIQGDTVVVSSDKVAEPVAVRYGWSNVPDVNLYNKEGLPASPFRTDIPLTSPTP
jgi:sialate O-acetylesterase